MTIVTRTNKNTANPKHWIVRDVFYGYTSSEQANWFVTITAPFNISVDGIIKYNYLVLKDDETPNTFNRLFYEQEVKAGDRIFLVLNKITPFSFALNCDDQTLQAEITSQINNSVTAGQPSDRLFLSNLDATIATWDGIFSESINTPIVPPSPGILISSDIYTIIPEHKFYPATNNLWHQDNLVIAGINDVDSNTYYKGDSYVFARFFANNGTDLINQNDMTNPYTLEIHKSLNSGKFANNELDNTRDRVANLGYYIEKNSNLLGHRIDANGKVQEAIEKSDRIRTAVEGDNSNDPLEYNPNGFGSKGMIVRHLPNKTTREGKAPGGYRKIHDLPQLLAEYHEQANAALGYQEGTAIEILIDGQKYRYPNQLALLTELLIASKQNLTYSKGAFFSSLVSEQSIKEVMAGLGLRTVDKFLEFKIADKTVKLYYKGISASQSIRRKLSAISTNIAMTLGNLQ